MTVVRSILLRRGVAQIRLATYVNSQNASHVDHYLILEESENNLSEQHAGFHAFDVVSDGQVCFYPQIDYHGIGKCFSVGSYNRALDLNMTVVRSILLGRDVAQIRLATYVDSSHVDYLTLEESKSNLHLKQHAGFHAFDVVPTPARSSDSSVDFVAPNNHACFFSERNYDGPF